MEKKMVGIPQIYPNRRCLKPQISPQLMFFIKTHDGEHSKKIKKWLEIDIPKSPPHSASHQHFGLPQLQQNALAMPSSHMLSFRPLGQTPPHTPFRRP